ncbi:MAG: phosphotransferase, partial [Clostridiales bacterium]|nr:phosphotransferase [Clostridiales bacterium]
MRLKSDFKFYSKRNTVILRDSLVEKRVASPAAAALEAAMLTQLHAAGVPVPELIAQEGSTIKMSYIDGEPLPDLLTRLETAHCERDTAHSIADSLIEWLADFYRAMDGQIRGDVNGRNFLWDGARWWGVDFEQRETGERAQDIGRLLAFVLTYDPPNTPIKRAFA